MKARSGLILVAAVLFGLGMLLTPSAAPAALPVSLDQVPVPEPANLGRFVKDKGAAVRLGKALFWDMQTGSDGRTACASCHFHAGTDNRSRNTLGPGPDGAFQVAVAGGAVRFEDFPFHQFQNPEDRASAVVRSRDDAVGAQGVPLTKLAGVVPGTAEERGRSLRDGRFSRNGRNVRQVTGRNAPSVINAAFNFANFWDGRANHFFNGVNPFGIMDTRARVHVNTGNGLAELDLTGNPSTNPFLLNNASLASQAVGPPLSDVEMSWKGRSWPLIGRKMLPLRPLAKQKVHATDSHFRQAPGLISAAGTGLNTTYADMVRAAFRDEFWNGGQVNGFSQMEANFSLFFGLAVQLYEATLVSDDTPFDRHLRGVPNALTASQARGMNIFFSGAAACANCHVGAELTGATVSLATDPAEPGIIEQMAMGDGALGNYDIGFYNIGVRPTSDDRGRGGRVTLNGIDIPLSFTGQFFERGSLPFQIQGVPGCVNNFVAEPPTICPPPDVVTRQAVSGAFKTPGLRNVELTGPYFHNGGAANLRQVVDFYVRGGNFREANIADLDPFIDTIGALRSDEARQTDLINFLLALTDERVRWEMAPFDHPQLFVPDGSSVRVEGNPKRSRIASDTLREIPAVGSAGRQAQGLPPLKPFLADGLSGQDLAGFHFR